jgi:hypothetical protein
MSYRRTLSCLTVAMLVAAAFVVPTAMAMPIDPTGGADALEPAPSAQQDQRGEAAVERSRPPASPRALPGPPTWPEHPTPINRAPAPAVSDGDGGGSDDFPVVLLVIGGALVLCGGTAAVVMRVRTRHAH